MTMTEYDESDLPETITVKGRTFEREKFDTDSFNWVYIMDNRPDDYEWDAENLDLKGPDAPIIGVKLQSWEGQWNVRGFETVGPEGPTRPGFAEPIGSDYETNFDELDAALTKVEALVERLVEERLPLTR